MTYGTSRVRSNNREFNILYFNYQTQELEDPEPLILLWSLYVQQGNLRKKLISSTDVAAISAVCPRLLSLADSLPEHLRREYLQGESVRVRIGKSRDWCKDSKGKDKYS